MIMHKVFVVLLSVIAVPLIGFAHASGQSFEKMTDTLFVDIGYDIPFQVGKETLIDVALFSVDEGEVDGFAHFTNLTLTIHSGSSVLYTGIINKPEFGKVITTMTPEKSGNWTLTADFEAEGVVIESASFDVTIAPAAEIPAGVTSNILIFSVIIVTLAACGFFIFRRAKSG